MANLTIDKKEILFLRENILSKFCGLMGYNYTEYIDKINSTIKYHEEIAIVMQEELQQEDNLKKYWSNLTEKSIFLFKKQFSNEFIDNKKILRECVSCISANVIRKLVFYSQFEVEQTYKNNFIYSCYYFIEKDRASYLKTFLVEKSENSNKTIQPSKIIKSTENRTIDILLEEKQRPTIRLIPLDSNNTMNLEKSILIFKKEKNLLNRENIDPDNNTITSKIQAELRYVNGKWIIENFSTLKSTYIQVLRPIELISGDIIQMGNLKFLIEYDS